MSDLVGNPEDRFSQNEAHIVLTVMSFAYIMLKSIVSHKVQGTGYQIYFILMYICIFIAYVFDM